MQTYEKNYYDLVTSGLGSLTKLQGYLDNVLAMKYNMLQLDGFTMASGMQPDFSYEQIQKELDINVMASYVDLDSDPVPFAAKGFSLSTGKIPRMKARLELDEDDIRKQLIIQQRFGNSSDRAMNAAKDALWNTTDTLIGSHTNSLTYQRHQMVSRGELKLLDTNNPRGLKNVAFGANVPDANKTILTANARWWTDAAYKTEGTTSNPIQDMKDQVEKAEDKGLTAMHFEIDKAFAKKVISHSKVNAAIAANLFPMATDQTAVANAAANLSFERKIEILSSIVGAPFKVIDSVVAIEKYNTATKKIERPQQRAFAPDVLVLVPDGNLGEVLTVEPIKLPLNNGTYADFYGGRLLMTVDYDIMKKIQYYQTEMTSLVVPSVPQMMFYLNIK
ncbi:MAG: major capsid protein [Muribaculaceae bacterium]